LRLLQFIAAMPRLCLNFIATFIYLLLWPFNAKDRRIIKANVDLVYGLPPKANFAGAFVRQNLVTQILVTLETIKYVFRPSVLDIRGLEEAKRVLSGAGQNSGVVIIAAHHGAWELAGHAAATCFDRPFYALAKPSKSARLTRILNEIRERLGMRVLWTDSKALLKEMMAVSSRQEHLGFVMDQRPGNRQGGHVCEFLGVKNTHMVPGPAMMAVRKNMPVCGIYMVRTGLCKYHFYVTEVLPLNHGLDDEQRCAQMMTDDMSRMIRMYPEQWAWNYRRWKK